MAANAVSVGIQMELAIRVFDIKGFQGLLDVVERVQNKLQGRWPSLLWVVVVAGFRLCLLFENGVAVEAAHDSSF
ncbi:hypothetical protein ACMFL9_03590 (plasmid) [Sinorhizobium meliloti]